MIPLDSVSKLISIQFCSGIGSKVVRIKRVSSVVAVIARREEILNDAAGELEALVYTRKYPAASCMRASSSHRSTSRRKTTDSSDVLVLAFPWFSSPVSLSFLPLILLSFPLWPCASSHFWYVVVRNRCKLACVHLRTYCNVRIIRMYTYTNIHIFTLPMLVSWPLVIDIENPLICYEVERLLFLCPPTKPPFPSSLPPFCFCERGGVSSYWHSTNN